MPFATEKVLLPAFPKTAHLPHKPNTDNTDSIATESEAGIIFTHSINIEEKIDGASLGVVWRDGNPIVRNRDHILRKGFVKETAAKKQFARKMLTELGFSLPHLYHQGVYDGDYESLEALANETSHLALSKVEGIYIKVYDSGVITDRFKMVREDFKRGALWNPKILHKNDRL